MNTDNSRCGWTVALGIAIVCAASVQAEDYDREVARQKYQRPTEIPFPADNPRTDASIELGQRLFFDPRLSVSDAISCASCHNPAFAWGDGLPKGIGHGSKPVGRRTPTVLNLAWGELMFWDGRASSLEDQALGPIEAPGEMNQPIDELLEELQAIEGYAPLFEKAYPGEGITPDTIAKAIANYERTIVSGLAPFDAWVMGIESAISEEAKHGFDLFNTKAGCVDCHEGWNFTDSGFHDIGIPGDDLGRGKILEGIEALEYAFKTPTLRNLRQRAPFMHDGSEATLHDVIELYNIGGRVKRPSLSPSIRELHLTETEVKALIAFLDTLTSADEPVRIATLPR